MDVPLALHSGCDGHCTPPEQPIARKRLFTVATAPRPVLGTPVHPATHSEPLLVRLSEGIGSSLGRAG